MLNKNKESNKSIATIVQLNIQADNFWKRKKGNKWTERTFLLNFWVFGKIEFSQGNFIFCQGF